MVYIDNYIRMSGNESKNRRLCLTRLRHIRCDWGVRYPCLLERNISPGTTLRSWGYGAKKNVAKNNWRAKRANFSPLGLLRSIMYFRHVYFRSITPLGSVIPGFEISNVLYRNLYSAYETFDANYSWVPLKRLVCFFLKLAQEMHLRQTPCTHLRLKF